MSYIALAHLASPDVLAGARKIKLFLMDVDGTLTDGGVCLISMTAADGSGTSAVSEVKVFNAGQVTASLNGTVTTSADREAK